MGAAQVTYVCLFRHSGKVRTTVEFDADTAKAIEELRRESGLGISEAMNELIRRAMVPRERTQAFVQPTRGLGLRIDVSNIADALESLEGPEAR
jgi:Ribbon-helix-helix protein, copG family